MDIITHGVASLAIVRGIFPRAGKPTIAAAVIAGTIADIDWLSAYFGPSAYLTWHHTCSHSIAFIFFLLAAIPSISVARHYFGPPSRECRIAAKQFWAGALTASFCAALLHIAMDACQSSGVMLLWPFTSKRFASDWLPGIDPWILTILIGAIAIPELLRLVGSEIGAKSKKPRGQTGAIIGLILLFAYIGARATFHSDAVAMLSSRNIHGETAHRAWAFPEPLSLITWHGVVETERSFDELDVNPTDARDFDPDSSVRNFKPETSPAFAAAQKTDLARQFLAFAQIPKARVEKTDAGYVVVLRDLRYAAARDKKHEIAAYFEFDRTNRLTTAELVWARDLPR